MANKPQPHIIFRLILAKTLFKTGLEFCDAKTDVFNFSHGLIALHDALDNFTGAVATHLNISLPQESKFLATLNLIQEHERQTDSSFQLISRNELVQLNTLRNNIKHQGITPNIAHNKALIGPIVSFFKEYSRKYFDLEWDVISLADLIKKKETQEALKKVEKLIEDEKYKDALNEMAIVKFQVFDESLMEIRMKSHYDLSPPSEEEKKLRESSNVFPGQFDRGWFRDLYDRADYLEKGIDRDMMRRFEDLTAKVGISNAKDWNYVLDHGLQWGDLNWTREICVFCFDFLVDSIIKKQGKDKDVEQKWITEVHKIRALNDIQIYDKDHNLLYTMAKGEEREVLALGRADGQWELFNPNDRMLKLYEEDGKEEVFGFFDEGEEDKIEFLTTQQFTRDGNGDFVLVKEF